MDEICVSQTVAIWIQYADRLAGIDLQFTWKLAVTNKDHPTFWSDVRL